MDFTAAEEVAPEIVFVNPLYERIANRVTQLNDDKKAYGTKKYIQTEFDVGPEYGKEAIKVSINTSDAVTASERGKITGQANAIDQLEQIRKLYQSFLKNGGTANLYTRWKTGLIRTTGIGAIDRDLNEMMVRIDKLYFAFRQDLTGAAFSDKEANQYRRLFPEISMGPERFFAGLDAVQNTHRDNMANFYKGIIGNLMYTDVFGAPEHKRVLTTTERAYVDATRGGTLIFDLNNILDLKQRKAAAELTEFGKETLPKFTDKEREILLKYATDLSPAEEEAYNRVLKKAKEEGPEEYNFTDDQLKKLVDGLGQYLN